MAARRHYRHLFTLTADGNKMTRERALTFVVVVVVRRGMCRFEQMATADRYLNRTKTLLRRRMECVNRRDSFASKIRRCSPNDDRVRHHQT